MTFTGFDQLDFDTFKIDGLEERMDAIKSRIQPKFKVIGQELTTHLSAELGDEMFLHIAKHARRSVNPPKDTWLAVAENKRGYKKHPHFQVGLFDDHVFIWLALIYELPNKQEIATKLLNDYSTLKQLPSDYVVSLDHMKKESFSITDLNEKHLERFRDIKKAEFLVGRHINSSDQLLRNGDNFITYVKETVDSLIPFYRTALTVE